MKKILYSIVAVGLLLAVDYYTKALAVLHLKNQNAVELIRGIFELRYLENRGAAFGALQGRQMFLLLCTAVVLIYLIYAFIRIPAKKKYVPLWFTMVLLFSGAVGNMIDRISRQYVVDFLYFKLINFPIFNVADCYVTVGVILLAILILFVYKEEDFDFLARKKMR